MSLRSVTQPTRAISNKSILLYAGLLALGSVAAALILYTTRWGPGLMDDAFIYVISAKNLAAGRGLTWPWGDGSLQPMTYFPPLYPLLLAGFEALGLEAVAAARVFNALAFAGLSILVGLSARRITGSSWMALAAALLILLSDVLIDAFSWAMSEPGYLLLAYAGFLALSQFIDQDRPGRGWLALAAVLLGLGFLTRYIGASLILSGLAALALTPNRKPARRLLEMSGFALLAGLPMAVWMLRNWLTIQGPIDRSFSQHLVTWNQLQNGLNTLLIWFIPGRLVHGRELLWLIGLLLGLALVAWLYRRAPLRPGFFATGRPFRGLRLLLGLHILLHIAVLLVSKSFFEASTPLNDRILAPILPSLILLLLAFLSDLWHTRWIPVRATVILVLLAFTGFYAYRAASLAPRLHASGLGFNRKGWQNSDTLEAIRALPEVPLYSNSPSAIAYWTQRPAYPIYAPEEMRLEMAKNDGRLVLFNSVSISLYKVTLEELTRDLTPVQTFQDGTIYALQP